MAPAMHRFESEQKRWDNSPGIRLRVRVAVSWKLELAAGSSVANFFSADYASWAKILCFSGSQYANFFRNMLELC